MWPGIARQRATWPSDDYIISPAPGSTGSTTGLRSASGSAGSSFGSAGRRRRPRSRCRGRPAASNGPSPPRVSTSAPARAVAGIAATWSRTPGSSRTRSGFASTTDERTNTMAERNSQPEQVSLLAQFWSSVNYPLNTEDPLQQQQDESDRLSATPKNEKRFRRLMKSGHSCRAPRSCRVAPTSGRQPSRTPRALSPGARSAARRRCR